MNLSKEIVLKFSYKKECFDVLAYLQTHENVCNKLVLPRRFEFGDPDSSSHLLKFDTFRERILKYNSFSKYKLFTYVSHLTFPSTSVVAMDLETKSIDMGRVGTDDRTNDIRM